MEKHLDQERDPRRGHGLLEDLQGQEPAIITAHLFDENA